MGERKQRRNGISRIKKDRKQKWGGGGQNKEKETGERNWKMKEDFWENQKKIENENERRLHKKKEGKW